MPETTDPDRRRHPVVAARKNDNKPRRPVARRGDVGYVELRVKSNFSFLRGASHPEELVERAVELGYRGLGISDVNTLAGVVRMHCAAKAAGLQLVVGAEMWLSDGPPIGLFAMDRRGYARLSRLITLGCRRASKGDCRLTVDDVCGHAGRLIGIVYGWDASAGAYRDAFGDRLYVGASVHHGANDRAYLVRAARLADAVHLPMVAVNDVHYHVADRRFLQDILVCVRGHCTVDRAGKRLFANGERYLKSPAAMARLFRDHPDALARTVEIAGRCAFSLDTLRYEYPPELCPARCSAADYLADLVRRGARRRYETGVPDKVAELIRRELELIAELGYEHYFLTVWDIVRFARSRGILCQGRGSAANSVVCYCLGITSVDPERVDLLFERFVSAERNEPPDIDVDFEHERREEVIQYIYRKYGRDRAGICAEVITYRPRSAVRDVGKALGLSLDTCDRLARKVEWWSNVDQLTDHQEHAGLDPNDRTMRHLVGLCRQLIGFPRHLSQHVGGFVITAGPLCELVPIENAMMPDRTFIEWDKDDIDALGILKIDVLSLGMLTAIRKAFDLIVGHGDESARRRFAGRDATGQLASVPAEDPAVYDMICRADTVGVFQIESRAQMSMLPRLLPRCYYDLVIEVAIVRPGPIQGGMVHPYLRRRRGDEPVDYPSDAVRCVLERTLGVPLFQEQVMRLAVVAGGFSPGQADQLRRSMAAWRRSGALDRFRDQLMRGMQAGGYTPAYAERIFNQIRGFGEYGFPESHAASFALLVYVSSWLKRYHPAAFAAAVINSQPMGFYAPAQLVRDARAHGVRVLGVDVNHSDYDCTLEGVEASAPGQGAAPDRFGSGGADLRLGMRLVKGISRRGVDAIVSARGQGRFGGIGDLYRRSGASRAVLLRLAAADAFGSMGLDRRQAVWSVLGLDDELPLWAGREPEDPPVCLEPMSLRDAVIEDYDMVGLSLRAHPMSLIRDALDGLAVSKATVLEHARQGDSVRVAGLVLVRQRPSTALGIVFMTLEDETGVVNLVIRPKVYARFRATARGATAMIATGTIERQGRVVHVQVQRMASLGSALAGLRAVSRDFH